MQPNMIGAYGPWAAALVDENPSEFSFRHDRWTDVESWRVAARQRFLQALAQPDAGPVPEATIHQQYDFDGLHIEKLSWQLPYGPPTEAVFLKPAGSTGKLPGILALHDHAVNKFFGKQKITRTDKTPHPLMIEHQQEYYGGRAWANEIAKRGYAVLVPDAFAFASRRVLIEDVSPEILPTPIAGESKIETYNRWADGHESIMAKSLFSAGTTWPGVFLTEDQRALDVLCDREDVDAERVGCGGLSGGGLRTVFLAGADPRIRCAVCAGMMTTWRDFLLNKSFTHTWMVYAPLLPQALEYPEILGLHLPQPTLVLNNSDDELFTSPEMKRADSILREAYEKAGAEDRYQCSFYPGPHKFDLDMQADAFRWFDRWL
jgi:dienelactone hydrolase